jgi:hypothetical protein
MVLFIPKLDSLSNVLPTMFDQLLDALRFIKVSPQPRSARAAENLFPASNWLCIWSARSTADSPEVRIGDPNPVSGPSGGNVRQCDRNKFR